MEFTKKWYDYSVMRMVTIFVVLYLVIWAPFGQILTAESSSTTPDQRFGMVEAFWQPDEAKELGAEVLAIDECFEIGIPAVIRRIHERIGNRQVYVSLDIDAVDPAFAPGTGTPEVGGFTSHQMLQLVRGLRGLNVAGFDLVEVNPPYDSSDITSILAANIIFEYLSLLAVKKTSR